MDWKNDLSESAKDTMNFMGDFCPTAHTGDKQVKGYMVDDDGGGKVYLTSGDLRQMAADFIEVAAWLEKRAVSENGE